MQSFFIFIKNNENMKISTPQLYHEHLIDIIINEKGLFNDFYSVRYLMNFSQKTV